MHFGCWNVQGISTKTDILTEELNKYDMDIVVISETKKKGNEKNYL
jgi:exonuclease III